MSEKKKVAGPSYPEVATRWRNDADLLAQWIVDMRWDAVLGE